MQLSLTTDRSGMHHAAASRRYVSAQMIAEHREGTKERAPLDIVLVIDVSGSMNGEPLLQAKRAAKAVLERLQEHDRLALIAFSSSVHTILPLSAVTADLQHHAEHLIDRLRCGGGTNLFEAWHSACKLLESRAGQTLQRCFLLTDGLPSTGITDATTFATQAKHWQVSHISTSTFGLGDHFDETLLGLISRETGGAFHDLALPEALAPALTRELGDALDIVHDDVRLRLQWDACLSVEVLGAWPITHGDNGQACEVFLGDLVSDQVLEVLCAISCPPGPMDQQVTLRLSVLDNAGNTSAATQSWTWVSEENNRAQVINPDMILRVARTHDLIARRKALSLNQAGEYAAACKLLHDLADGLKELAVNNHEVLAIIDQLHDDADSLYQEALPARSVRSISAMTQHHLLGRDGEGRRTRLVKPFAMTKPAQPE